MLDLMNRMKRICVIWGALFITVSLCSGAISVCATGRECGVQPIETKYNDTPQLTQNDIQEMNNGNAIFTYSKNGYLTFLKGRFYDKPVADYNEVIEALYGIADMLGLRKGSDFFCVYGQRINDYTIFTYKQRYGSKTIENATLKVFLDPWGYPTGLSSSFTPNLGIAPDEEYQVTAEEAEQIVREQYPENEMTVLPEYTVQTAVTVDDIAYHAWAVYTVNTDAEAEQPYIEHLIAYTGSYLFSQLSTFPESPDDGDTMMVNQALSIFDDLEPAVYSGEVTTHDGSNRQVELNIAYSPESEEYVLVDLERHMVVADFYDYATVKQITILSSKDNTGWPEKYLLTYETYQRVYDYFSSMGMDSIDGFGMPMLILKDYCDENRRLYNNAAYMGMREGWALFGASSSTDYGECLDAQGHEFTHGIYEYCVGGDIYSNESGAINEALADIMGNICETSLGEGNVDCWLIGEGTGNAIRNMKDPSTFSDPVAIMGQFYVPTRLDPKYSNDYGGIHTNSSILGHIGWTLYARGLNVDASYSFWYTVMNLITPSSGYKEMRAAMLTAAEMDGLSSEWSDAICQAWTEAGLA